MTQTATPAGERAHDAAKRYIYAWGGGRPRATRRCATCSVARARAWPR